MVDHSAIDLLMREYGSGVRGLIEALEEPALIVERGMIVLSNGPARALLGSRVEGRDVRLAIRHPQVLEQILANRSADLEVTGIAEPGRPWRLSLRPLDDDTALLGGGADEDRCAPLVDHAVGEAGEIFGEPAFGGAELGA